MPPTETASPRQYAHPILYDNTSSLDSAVFCSTCTKNQQLLTEALSNYLPPLDDPAYSQYEASFPAYRQNLENRYPQVCATCEPKVRARIQQAGYHAKADHLRRMMERSRARHIANRLGWRSLVVRAGGLGYCVSITGQLLWHAMSAFSSDFRSTEATASYFGCIDQCLRDQQVSAQCAKAFAPVTGLALFISLCCIWWNPQWHHKLDGSEGRLTGLSHYYELQAGILILRFVSWIWLRESETSGLSLLHQRAVHSILLVLQILLTTYSLLAIVKVDTTPLVSWQESPAPMLSRRQYVPPQQPMPDLFSPRPSQSLQDSPESFLVNNLASGTRTSYEAWRPLTPPEEDVDAMEWEPTSNPQFRPRAPKPPSQPSPFHGTLPSLPNNRLLQPKSQTLPQPRQAIGVPPGFFDRLQGNAAKGQSDSAKAPAFAQPKFFTRQDRETDTGLESMFDSVFSLNADPVEVREQQASRSLRHRNGAARASAKDVRVQWQSPSQIIHCFTAAVSAISFLTWILLNHSGANWSGIKFGITSLNALIPLLGVFLRLPEIVTLRCFNDLRWPLAESCAFAVLGAENVAHKLLDAQKRDFVVSAVLSVVFWQEFYLCFPKIGSQSPIAAAQPNAFAVPPQTAFGRQEKLASVDPQATPHSESEPSPCPSSSWQSHSSRKFPAFSPRPRANSIDSTATDVSTASTVTTSGWKTPKRTGRGVSQSPGFTLGSLALDDGRYNPNGRSIGPAQRGARRRAEF